MGYFSRLSVDIDEAEREELVFCLSFKGFTSDKLNKLDTQELRNLYVEYIVCNEDYV